MTLSIRNTLRSLSLLALTAAFLPGCDSEEYEALGLSSQEIDAMSEEELDELAALEDDDSDLEHSVDPVAQDITAPLPPSDPDAGPDDLTTPPTHGNVNHFDIPTTLWAPTYTHNGPQGIDVADTLWAPRYTHSDGSAIEVVEGIAVPVHPTHGKAQTLSQLGVPDPGCQPPTEDTQLSNG